MGYAHLIPAGVILTGGSSILEGVPELTEQIFNLPVRRGIPTGIGGLVDLVSSPIYATGVGLVLYGSRNRAKNRFRVGEVNLFSKVTHRMREWIGEFF
jgi:cell division protein FtsA